MPNSVSLSAAFGNPSNVSTRISVLPSWPTSIARPTASVAAFLFILSIPSDSGSRGSGPTLPPPGTENPEAPHSKRFLMHLSVSPLPSTCLLARCRALSGRQGQRRGVLWAPPRHRPENSSRQMTHRQEQPILAGMFDWAPARLHRPLLQARQRHFSALCGSIGH